MAEVNNSSIATIGHDPEEQGNAIVVKLDTAALVEATEKAGQLVFNPSAEDAIVKVLHIQQQVNEAVEAIKAEIERQGLAVNPNFTSVVSDKLKVNYSASGAEFGYDATKRKRFPAPLFTKKVTYSPNSKEIKKYREKTGKWPAHVFVNERKKTIRISLKEQ